MCGRYTLKTPPGELQQEFELSAPAAITARYNIAPSQSVPIVVEDRGRKLELARWGLIPHWAKDEKIGYKMINARGETLAEKPSYREALKERRCLVPADGFYEWKKDSQGKTPMHLRLAGGRLLAFAGLWESWQPKSSGPPVRSCTIITTAANARVAPIHDRMPLILTREQYARWLAPGPLSPAELADLVRPYAKDDLEAYAVSALVNSPKHDEPGCVAPA
jgi:putative SOS response-associated peptidase YedK